MMYFSHHKMVLFDERGVGLGEAESPIEKNTIVFVVPDGEEEWVVCIEFSRQESNLKIHLTPSTRLQPSSLVHLFPQKTCGKHWMETGVSLCQTSLGNKACSGKRRPSSPCCSGLTWDHKSLPAWTWEGAASCHTAPSCLCWFTHSAACKWRPFPVDPAHWCLSRSCMNRLRLWLLSYSEGQWLVAFLCEKWEAFLSLT